MNKDNDIKVSICCMCFNHEKYIEDALNGFLMQKTNFKYEVIIHDDASTDDSQKIIRKYQKKYPNIIKPILQKENQYSKHEKRIIDIMSPYMRGKYVAFCEGDDYWIDESKLQVQVDYLESHPDCSFSTHSYTRVNKNNELLSNEVSYLDDREISIIDFINQKVNIQTATVLCRNKYLKSLPSYYYNATIGDLPQFLYFLSVGYGYYFSKNMSCYRYLSEGSWTLKNKNNYEFKIKNHEMVKNIYKEFNAFNKNKYTNEINKYLLKFDFEFALSINNFEEIKLEKYKKLYKNLSLKEKIKIILKSNRAIYKIYKKFKHRSK